MQNLGTIVAPLITITGAVVIGFIMRVTGIFRGDEAGLINRIVLTVLMPVFVFSAIKGVTRKDNLPLDILKIPIIAYMIIGLSFVIAYVVGRYILRLERTQLGAFLLTSIFGSTGFIGLPLVNATFPNPADPTKPSPMILQHSFYSELGSLTLLVTIGVLIASFYGEKVYGEKATFNWRILLDIPKNGPFLGMTLGLLFYTADLPEPVVRTLSFLGQATLPLMMFSLGLTIVWKDVRRYLAPVAAMNVIKLIIAPIIAILLARLLGVDKNTQGVILLNASTPAIVICLVYAAQYKLDREFASVAVFSSFFFCLITIPLMQIIFL